MSDVLSEAPQFSLAMVTEAPVRQLAGKERHGANIFNRGWQKAMLNGDHVYTIQPVRSETVMQCGAFLELPSVVLTCNNRRGASLRYTLSSVSVAFVMKWGSLGPAPKRKRVKISATVVAASPVTAISSSSSSSAASVQPSRQTLQLWAGGYNDVCDVCDSGGELYCCSFCNLVFHRMCLDEQAQGTLDNDPWACKECVEEEKKSNEMIT